MLPRVSSYSGSLSSTADTGLPLLFLAACPMLLWLFDGSATAIGAVGVHFGLIALAIRLITRGRIEKARFDAAKSATRPRVPRLILGAMSLGFLVFLLAAGQFTTLVPALGFGVAGTIASLGAFGVDPLRHKGLDDPEYLARKEAEHVIATADAALVKAVTRVAQLDEPELTLRIESVRSAMLRLLRACGTQPDEVANLRKPLERFIELIAAETERLETEFAIEPKTAGRRYAARIALLSDGFEARARQKKSRTSADAFAFDADLLAERLEERHAA
ncbi:hypothetical protein [Litorisediminicola beolgyonensis]|uniref:5-bromo-4-chloroindolyl phosphate hydrolysis protein n=1 Tax=Litorisediminicola beolgyonensis TaxID=1173614 RepID=A0ABW3ZFY7_9RHOB